jgi:hypothetical protein
MPTVGATVSGSAIFDSDQSNYITIDTPPAFPNYSAYQISGPPYYFSIQAPPRDISSGILALEVADNDLTLFGIATPGDLVAFSTKRDGFAFSLLLSGPASSFTGILIPDPNLISTFWTNAVVIARDDFLSGANFQASVGTVTISPVPEMTSGALLIFGILALNSLHILRRN